MALANGFPAVVKAALTGAILANLLLGRGVALVAGGLEHGDLWFDSTRLRISSSMLMLSAFCFIIPAIFSLGEILSGTHFARRGRTSLLLSATVGSTIQTVLLVAPLLVFAGMLPGQPMDLTFTGFEVVAIVLGTVITRELIQDGRANWFEGVLLIAADALLAIGFLHLPQ